MTDDTEDEKPTIKVVSDNSKQAVINLAQAAYGSRFQSPEQILEVTLKNIRDPECDCPPPNKMLILSVEDEPGANPIVSFHNAGLSSIDILGVLKITEMQLLRTMGLVADRIDVDELRDELGL